MCIRDSICFMDVIKRSTLRRISAISSLPLLLTDTVKSPSVIALMTFVSLRTGDVYKRQPFVSSEQKTPMGILSLSFFFVKQEKETASRSLFPAEKQWCRRRQHCQPSDQVGNRQCHNSKLHGAPPRFPCWGWPCSLYEDAAADGFLSRIFLSRRPDGSFL